MASSLDSLDPAGSPVKPGSSVTHLCMSVKRTVNGSVSGCLSASAMAISSKLSQVNVCGIGLLLTKSCHLATQLVTLPSVIRFFRVVFVPVGNLYHDIRRPVRDRLAAQPRLRRDARRFVQLIEFRIRGFVARFEAL